MSQKSTDEAWDLYLKKVSLQQNTPGLGNTQALTYITSKESSQKTSFVEALYSKANMDSDNNFNNTQNNLNYLFGLDCSQQPDLLEEEKMRKRVMIHNQNSALKRMKKIEGK